MIDQIFAFESTRVRHRAAPLLEEREAYLTHLYNQATPIDQLRSIAATLTLIVRFMGLQSMRFIDPFEVEAAARCWCSDPCRARGRYPKSSKNFSGVATRWFRFAGVMNHTPTVRSESESIIDDFYGHITVDRGFSDQVVRGYMSRVSFFLSWIKNKRLAFADISVSDVNEYVLHLNERGLTPTTINGTVAALRSFFRYADSVGLNTSRIARSLRYLTVSRHSHKLRGPEWRDVRHLLDHGFGTSPWELRAAAVISLCAIYALRRCEIVRLKLSDIDWVTETITIRRGKSGRIQKFPLQFEVGQTILDYLRNGRGKCTCRNLFVSIRRPYKPLEPTVTYDMLSNRLRHLNIEAQNFGLHSLRHSCATKLLRDGSSLKDIADFLGHADMSSVSIYAKFDIKALKNIAEFSLAGLT